jgi:hypothetical protein
MKNLILTIFALQLMSAGVFAKNIKCQDFTNTENKLNVESEKLSKNLIQLNQQLISMQAEVDKYNKNCQNSSSSNCNPGMHNMMMSQLPILTGQKNKTESDIVALKTKATEAHDNFLNCKKAMAVRK